MAVLRGHRRCASPNPTSPRGHPVTFREVYCTLWVCDGYVLEQTYHRMQNHMGHMHAPHLPHMYCNEINVLFLLSM